MFSGTQDLKLKRKTRLFYANLYFIEHSLFHWLCTSITFSYILIIILLYQHYENNLKKYKNKNSKRLENLFSITSFIINAWQLQKSHKVVRLF